MGALFRRFRPRPWNARLFGPCSFAKQTARGKNVHTKKALLQGRYLQSTNLIDYLAFVGWLFFWGELASSRATENPTALPSFIPTATSTPGDTHGDDFRTTLALGTQRGVLPVRVVQQPAGRTNWKNHEKLKHETVISNPQKTLAQLDSQLDLNGFEDQKISDNQDDKGAWRFCKLKDEYIFWLFFYTLTCSCFFFSIVVAYPAVPLSLANPKTWYVVHPNIYETYSSPFPTRDWILTFVTKTLHLDEALDLECPPLLLTPLR